MRVKNWQIFVLAVTALWIIGAGIYLRSDEIDRAESFAKLKYKSCVEDKARGQSQDTDCDSEEAKERTTWGEANWTGTALRVLPPIPLAWFAAFVLYYFGKAQWVGFRAVVPWGGLVWYKKAVVVLSVLGVLLIAFFCLLVVLDAQIDAKVPITIGYKKSIYKFPDHVHLEGTWRTVEDGRADSMWDSPLQTSRIECNRSELKCIEALAYVTRVSSSKSLGAKLIEYKVTRWNDSVIVFQNELPCLVDSFTIDLNAGVVNGISRVINSETDFCKKYPPNKKKVSYALEDGFGIYMEERQKARPWLMRVIQALFGN